MQSIGRAKHTVLMVTPWPLTDCVHWHKMKINVSLYRKLLFLELKWLNVQFHNTSEMQSIGRVKHTVLMVIPWPLTIVQIVFIGIKRKIIYHYNYGNLLLLQIMLLKVQSFIT